MSTQGGLIRGSRSYISSGLNDNFKQSYTYNDWVKAGRPLPPETYDLYTATDSKDTVAFVNFSDVTLNGIVRKLMKSEDTSGSNPFMPPSTVDESILSKQWRTAPVDGQGNSSVMYLPQCVMVSLRRVPFDDAMTLVNRGGVINGDFRFQSVGNLEEIKLENGYGSIEITHDARGGSHVHEIPYDLVKGEIKIMLDEDPSNKRKYAYLADFMDESRNKLHNTVIIYNPVTRIAYSEKFRVGFTDVFVQGQLEEGITQTVATVTTPALIIAFLPERGHVGDFDWKAIRAEQVWNSSNINFKPSEP